MIILLVIDLALKEYKRVCVIEKEKKKKTKQTCKLTQMTNLMGERLSPI